MATPPLPPNDHVVRFVKKRLLRRDADQNLLGVLPHAFQRRPDEEYLSVTWLQHFSRDYEAGLSASAGAIRRQLNVNNGDGFTTGQVRAISDICASRSCRVRILHEPEPESNSGHSALRNLADQDLELLQMLADDAFIDTRLSAALP